MLLLLHGFPEIAFSWRKVMPALAAAGFHVVAPDQRGYGRTTGWDAAYDGDLGSFRLLNLVRDMLGLLAALGPTSVTAVVGHDFGASAAAWCALVRPDVFRALVLMSAPFGGPPALTPSARPAVDPVHAEMAALPRPRKHYQWYYLTRPANENMWHCPQGVHAFLRAYYHHKSADWPLNKPFRLASWSAAELAKMPTYYIMDAGLGMAETVAAEMPSPAEIAACRWLTEAELRSTPTNTRGPDSRAGCNGTARAPRASVSAICRSSPAEPRRARAVHRGPQRLGHFSDPRRDRAHARHRLFRPARRASDRGRGPLVQQEKPDEVNALLLAFLKTLP